MSWRLRAAATRGGLPDRLTPAQITGRLESFAVNADEIARALVLARFHARGLRHLGPEDLPAGRASRVPS